MIMNRQCGHHSRPGQYYNMTQALNKVVLRNLVIESIEKTLEPLKEPLFLKKLP